MANKIEKTKRSAPKETKSSKDSKQNNKQNINTIFANIFNLSLQTKNCNSINQIGKAINISLIDQIFPGK